MPKTCPTCQREFSEDVEFCPHDGMKLRRRRQEGDDPMLGRVLDDRWVIESRIGVGGMGAVYLAHQRSVNRKVAIKTLRAALADTDDFVDRFFQEVKVTATFNHPHSVMIHDFGQAEDGTLYLAMEYLEGQPLTDHAEEGSMTMEEILQVGMQIASALSAAHDAKIVHRDLKPDNIFLLDIPGGGTFVKVLDFGIAKVLDADTQMTRTGQIFGTPQYMSPEQCQGLELDGRSDLYSLGCILYELVGGRPPFGGETPMAVLMGHVASEVPPLRDRVGASLDPRLEAEIMALLAKEPDDRPATAAEARSRLEAVLSAMGTAQLRHTASQLAIGAPPPAASPAPDTEPRQSILDTMGSQPVDAEPQESGLTAQFMSEAGLGGSKSKTTLIIIALVALALMGAGGVAAMRLLGERDGDDEEVAAATDEEVTIEAAGASDEKAEDELPDPVEIAEDRAQAIAEEAEKVAQEIPEEELKEEAPTAQKPVEEKPKRQVTRPSRPARPAPQRPRPAAQPGPAPQPRPQPAPEPPAEKAPQDDPFDFFGHD